MGRGRRENRRERRKTEAEIEKRELGERKKGWRKREIGRGRCEDGRERRKTEEGMGSGGRRTEEKGGKRKWEMGRER